MTHSERRGLRGGSFKLFKQLSFLFSFSHFFTEACQLLYIKSVPFLLTISTGCQGVNQKAHIFSVRFINKTQFCFRHLEPCQSCHDDVSLPGMFTFLMLGSTFPGLEQMSFQSSFKFQGWIKKACLVFNTLCYLFKIKDPFLTV